MNAIVMSDKHALMADRCADDRLWLMVVQEGRVLRLSIDQAQALSDWLTVHLDGVNE